MRERAPCSAQFARTGPSVAGAGPAVAQIGGARWGGSPASRAARQSPARSVGARRVDVVAVGGRTHGVLTLLAVASTRHTMQSVVWTGTHRVDPGVSTCVNDARSATASAFASATDQRVGTSSWHMAARSHAIRPVRWRKSMSGGYRGAGRGSRRTCLLAPSNCPGSTGCTPPCPPTDARATPTGPPATPTWNRGRRGCAARSRAGPAAPRAWPRRSRA